jgi:glycosyltransferase involved in cell wall biosynthesis
VKILHVYKDYFPVVGGIENHIKILAEAQAARGHTVTVLVTSLDRQAHVEQINGVRVVYTSRIVELSSAPISLDMFRRVANIETDITHLHSPYPFGEMAHHLLGRSRATVLTYHSDIVRQRVMGALYSPALERVLAGVNTIIATSPNYVESSRVLRRWRGKCVVVPLASPSAPLPRVSPGIVSSPPLFSPLDPSPPTPALIESDIERGGKVGRGRGIARGGELLFVGKLRYYKGVNYLLEALTLLPDAHLTIVGRGPMERAWKDLAETLRVTPRVVWTGDVSDADLPWYYAACDVFVLPCSERSEAFGTVQLEAMAAGKPIVSCDVNTGVAWVNQNESTGLVVPPKNPHALADAIGRLLNDAALRARMGAAGRERAENEFSVEKMVEGVMQVYEQALATVV